MSKTRILITFKEEIADHDGYCSGEENEFTCRTYTKEVEVTELNADIQLYWCYADINDISRRNQSFYCRMSKEGEKAGMFPHSVRNTVVKVITVVKAELCDSKEALGKKHILITFKEEKSNHDGYWDDDNENKYTCRTYTKVVECTELNPDINTYICYADNA
jgi:hypothetical protein